MDIPPQVTQWVDKTYVRPRVDPEWLNDCYAWLTTEGGHDPNADPQGLLNAIEYQVLESNLGDSMLPGTGLPTHVAQPTTTTVLKGLQILVEVASITEVGHSAFSLNQTRIAREERMKAGCDDEEGEGDIEVEGEGPMPKYSRGMLKLHLFDGTTTLPAMEYRSLPDLSLENTPLGYKMLLKDVSIRRGVAFLEPKCVTLLGHKTEDRDEHRLADFARGLRARMRLPEPQPEKVPVQDIQVRTAIAPQPRTAPPAPQDLRSPLRDISPPPSPPLIPEANDDEDLEPRRRRIPNHIDVPAPAHGSSSALVASGSRRAAQGITTSTYFIDHAKPPPVGLGLSPSRRATMPLFIDTPPPSPPHDEHFWSDDEMPDANDGNRMLNVGSASQQSQGKGKGNVSGSEYGDDSLELDSEFLAGLDTAEKEAFNRTGCIQPPSSTMGSVASKSSLSAPGQSTQSSAHRTQPEASRTTGSIIEVITIEDDEDDGDDKENLPVPTRHVRRRMQNGGSGDRSIQPPGPTQRAREAGRPAVLARTISDVIDLSDSD